MTQQRGREGSQEWSLAPGLALHSRGTVFPQLIPIRRGSSRLNPFPGPGVWAMHRITGRDPSGKVRFLSDSVMHTWGRGTRPIRVFCRTRKPPGPGRATTTAPPAAVGALPGVSLSRGQVVLEKKELESHGFRQTNPSLWDK